MLSCDLNSITDLRCNLVDTLLYSQIPDEQLWRIGLIHELLNIRVGEIEVPGFTPDDISDILDFTCIS